MGSVAGDGASVYDGPRSPAPDASSPDDPDDNAPAVAPAAPSLPGATAGEPPPPAEPPAVCDVTAAAAELMVTTSCGDCHGDGPRIEGGLRDIADLALMVERGLIVPFNSAGSRMFQRIDAGQMPPPGSPAPAASEIDVLRTWIDCGARPDPEVVPTREPIPLSAALTAIQSDLEGRAAGDRGFQRYIVLTHLYNLGNSDEDLALYREAVSLAVNSLSTDPQITVPEPIDDAQTVLRVDLRDYRWDSETWAQIEAAYPYAVDYRRGASAMGFDASVDASIRELAGTTIPYVFGDWLVGQATRGELYYGILELPLTLAELKAQEDIGDEAFRTGFAESGVSFNNRVFEHRPSRFGDYWESFDFASSVGDKNIFENPVDFNEDGGEMIFSLPNGLQAYFVTDAAGTRLNEAPREIVADPSRPDAPIEAGVSCMGCHDTSGIIRKDDEIRPYAEATITDPADREAVLELYPQPDVLEARRTVAETRFRAARGATEVRDESIRPVSALLHEYEGRVDLERAAATLGITPSQLMEAVSADPDEFPGTIVGFQTPGYVIRRELFEQSLLDTQCALGLGRALACGDPVQRCLCPGEVQR